MTEVDSRKRIVLIEDNPSDVFLLRHALDEHGVTYDLELLRDGEQALAYFSRLQCGQETRPDLVIMDLNLPRHDGIEVLAGCRRSSDLLSMQVIVLTSSNSPKERQKAEQLGISDFVLKPTMLDEFMAVGGRIKQLLEGRPALS